MPIITCKVTDQEMDFIDRHCGANRSEYIRKCILAGPAEQRGQHQQLHDQIESLGQKIDFIIDRENGGELASVLADLQSAVKLISNIKFPPPGQMLMHESIAVESLLLLRTLASPEKMRNSMNETKRNGYKPWEPKEV